MSPVTVLRPGDEALTALFSGSLNRILCASCRAAYVLDVPILYRDDRRRYLVYFMSVPEAGDWKAAEHRMERLTEYLFADLGEMEEPDCRLVTARGDLIEKIALHQRGLDDRLVEYVKFQLFQNPDWKGKLDPVRHRLLYDFSREAEGNLAFIVFDRESGRASAGAHIPMADFREIVRTFRTSARLREELDKLFPGYYVSVDRLL